MSISEAVELTAQDVIPRLNKETVTDLVLVSMLSLPDRLPSHFHSTYTPIAAAGGPTQVAHLARLLSTQMTSQKIGVGYEKMEAMKQVCSVTLFQQRCVRERSIWGRGGGGSYN